jgi:hypothetical protein
MNKETYDLDAIEVAARHLVTLLEDRHPGLYTWNVAVLRAIKTLMTLVAIPDSLRGLN